jgi:hypothetical protein
VEGEMSKKRVSKKNVDSAVVVETVRIQPIPGLFLNGKPVLQDVETGDIVDESGKPIEVEFVNSCDALRIMDRVRDDDDDR